VTTVGARLRNLPRPVVIGALVLVAALIAVGIAVALTTDSGTQQGKSPSESRPIVTTTEAPTTSTQPTTTTALPTTTASVPGEDRLSSASLLGYAGLGPIKLGMAFDDAVAAAHVTVQPDPTCDTTLYGEPGSGVASISVWGRPTIDTVTVSQPGIHTISGVEVGSDRDDVLRTYPAAAPEGPSLVITGPDGHIIVFSFTGAETVDAMTLSTSLQTLDVHGRC
jgi:hypothetical protein